MGGLFKSKDQKAKDIQAEAMRNVEKRMKQAPTAKEKAQVDAKVKDAISQIEYDISHNTFFLKQAQRNLKQSLAFQKKLGTPMPSVAMGQAQVKQYAAGVKKAKAELADYKKNLAKKRADIRRAIIKQDEEAKAYKKILDLYPEKKRELAEMFKGLK